MTNLKIEVYKHCTLLSVEEVSILVTEKNNGHIIFESNLKNFIGHILGEFENLHDDIRRLKNKVSVLEEKSTPPRS